MTLFRLPEPVAPSASVEERLEGIEARLDILIEGVRGLLTEVIAIRQRWQA